MQQLQMATTPATVHLFFTLLAASLGLPSIPTPLSHNPETKKKTGQPGQVAAGVVDELAVKQLLQQPWVMSQWLTVHPLGLDMAAAWDSGLTDILNSTLRLSHRAELPLANALREACQPYLCRYCCCAACMCFWLAHSSTMISIDLFLHVLRVPHIMRLRQRHKLSQDLFILGLVFLNKCLHNLE